METPRATADASQGEISGSEVPCRTNDPRDPQEGGSNLRTPRDRKEGDDVDYRPLFRPVSQRPLFCPVEAVAAAAEHHFRNQPSPRSNDDGAIEAARRTGAATTTTNPPRPYRSLWENPMRGPIEGDCLLHHPFARLSFTDTRRPDRDPSGGDTSPFLPLLPPAIESEQVDQDASPLLPLFPPTMGSGSEVDQDASPFLPLLPLR
ncbi:hypothetical protein PG994_014164 [Apiospora phragmitis]|uniref:Uncharacterized protein n=1 Tax=Apiospora phragmitis TaxID=2905665 RepID=A0ABR1T3K3_9PEZI